MQRVEEALQQVEAAVRRRPAPGSDTPISAIRERWREEAARRIGTVEPRQLTLQALRERDGPQQVPCF